MKQKAHLYMARVYWRVGKVLYRVADLVGDWCLLEWSQRHFDHAGEWCMGRATRHLMQYYWMMDPDAEWES